MVNQKSENNQENEAERKSRPSIRITKQHQVTIPRLDSTSSIARSSTQNSLVISDAKKIQLNAD
jgi:hypothetical protein